MMDGDEEQTSRHKKRKRASEWRHSVKSTTTEWKKYSLSDWSQLKLVIVLDSFVHKSPSLLYLLSAVRVTVTKTPAVTRTAERNALRANMNFSGKYVTQPYEAEPRRANIVRVNTRSTELLLYLRQMEEGMPQIHKSPRLLRPSKGHAEHPLALHLGHLADTVGWTLCDWVTGMMRDIFSTKGCDVLTETQSWRSELMVGSTTCWTLTLRATVCFTLPINFELDVIRTLTMLTWTVIFC